MELTSAMGVFVAVVDEEGFTAAGRALGMPTATVSRQIARLEEHLGVRLLQRTTRRVMPTEAGERYYERAKRVVQEIREAEADVRHLQDTPRGRLRLSLPAPGSNAPVMEHMVTQFACRYPEVSVEAVFTNRYVDLVQEGFDAAIRAGRLRDSSLRARKINDSRHGCIASPRYLEARGRPTDHGTLADHDCLVYRMELGRTHWPLLNGNRFEVTGRIVSDNMQMLVEAAAASLGIALVPLDLVRGHLRDGRLTRVLEGEVGLLNQISVVYPHHRYVPAKVRALIDIAIEFLGDET